TTAGAAAIRSPDRSADKRSRSPAHDASRFPPANRAAVPAKTHPASIDPTSGFPPSTRPTAADAATQTPPAGLAPHNHWREPARPDLPDTRPARAFAGAPGQTPR